MMVEAGLKPSKKVSHVGYSPVVARLDTAIDAMNRVGDIVIASNQPKGKKTQPSRPQRRPTSVFARLQHDARVQQHKALTARLLPDGVQPERPRVAGERRRDRRLLDGTAVAAPLGSNVFQKKGQAAAREEERTARWTDRAREVGRVPESNPPVT